MAPKPDTQPEHAPAGLTDYVVRFSMPGRASRATVFRAANESAAIELAHDAATTGRWQGWAIVELLTVEESIARRGGTPR